MISDQILHTNYNESNYFIVDEYHETVVQENSDEDFQPTTSRKRKSMYTSLQQYI